MIPARLCTAFLLLPGSFLFAQMPSVAKVEPPNWFTGHTLNPVRLLIRGENLTGASIESPRDLRTRNVKVSANGTYLFVDVEIPKKTKAGNYPLTLKTKAGSAAVPFRLEEGIAGKDLFQGFSTDDIIYLLMPDRFSNGDEGNDNPSISPGLFDRKKPRYYHGGDFKGIIGHLPYLKDLGVTTIWTTPVYDNVNHLNEKEQPEGVPVTDYHGYGAVDYYGVDEHLGSLDDLRRLVAEAHRLGLKVLQDQVCNHVGPYHPWVQNSPAPTWFHGSAQKHLADTWQLWTLVDPHSSPALRKPVVEGWFSDILPDMNQEDPDVARYEIQNTLWWLATVGFDGIRQDTWPYVSRLFWRDWMTAIKRQYPHTRVVGEMFDGDPALVSFFQGGRAQYDGVDDLVDSVFDFPLYFALRDTLGQGKPLTALPSLLAHDYLYPAPDRLVTFLGLHDVPRFMNEPHASIANLKLAFTVLLTTRGIPMIYSGDEIGLPGGNDPDNRRDFPGGWPGDAHNAFERTGRTREEQEVFAHLRKLNRLRAGMPALRQGRTLTLAATDTIWAYARQTKQELAVVVINAGTGPGQVQIALSDLGIPSLSKWSPQLGDTGGPVMKDGVAHITLPPGTSEIYSVSGSF